MGANHDVKGHRTSPDGGAGPPPLGRALFGAAFFGTGAALVAYILSGISLALTGLLFVAGGAVVAIVVWRRIAQPDRVRLRRCMRVGLVAGLLATGAYNLTRVAIVLTVGTVYWPFETWSLFGEAMLGAGASRGWALGLGTAFHLANGIGFAVAYTVWFGRHGVPAGIVFALGLEAAMLTFYPTWLDIRAWREFVSVSVIGHFAYGAALGATAQRLLRRGDRELAGRPA